MPERSACFSAGFEAFQRMGYTLFLAALLVADPVSAPIVFLFYVFR